MKRISSLRCSVGQAVPLTDDKDAQRSVRALFRVFFFLHRHDLSKVLLCRPTLFEALFGCVPS